MLAVVAAVF